MAPTPVKREKPDLENYRAKLLERPPLSPATLFRIDNYFDKYREFLLSSLDFDEPENEEWNPVRMLGSGSYAQVGLWRRTGPNNETIDEVALKEELRKARSAEPDTVNHEGLTREAVIHTQLNELGSESIVHLRRYKYLPEQPTADSSDSGGKYRSYFELCPHGTLATLARRYSAWDQHLPEVFVWHVFNSLAEALCIMEKGPSINFFTRRKYEDADCVVHLDLKPQNIFLGSEPESLTTGKFSVKSHFCSIKLSDFGMSRVTGPSDSRNPEAFWWTCSENFRPLEHYNYPQIYGSHFSDPPNGYELSLLADDEDTEEWKKDPGFKFGSAHNVGSVGKCMYDLVTLSDSSNGFYRAVFAQRNAGGREQEQEYLDRDAHAIDEISAEVEGNEVYSKELRDLIRECNRPTIDWRPEPDDLLKATKEGLRKAEEKINNRDRALDPSLKVFYAKNDINAMPRGRARFTASLMVWAAITKLDWLEPEWGALRPPVEKWARMMQRTRGREENNMYRMRYGQEIDVDEDGKIVFVFEREAAEQRAAAEASRDGESEEGSFVSATDQQSGGAV